MLQHPHIAVIGSGSWATAISKLLLNNCSKLHWYFRNAEHITSFKNHAHNPKYLTDVKFPTDRITFYTSLEDCLQSAELIILAIPSAFINKALMVLPQGMLSKKLIFSAIKGIEPENLAIMGDYLHRHHQVPLHHIGVITGPCHAEEVAMEKLSYLTLASVNTDMAQNLASLLKCEYMNVSISDDIYGTEYAAVLKNIIAIACGIAHGLGYGDNYQAVLVSNAIQEIKRYVDAVHPINRDIKASAYLGDLLVTCYSQFSRNRTFGTMLGKGYSVQHAQLEMNMIAEGYYASNCIHNINKTLMVHMPISECVYNIIYNHTPPSIAFKTLRNQLS
jgi:glycerol-3-phosphate dehydrogenase (NAD(P)+)